MLNLQHQNYSILAIEAGRIPASITLIHINHERVIGSDGEIISNDAQSFHERALPTIEKLLKRAEISKLSAIAFGSGPGLFSGIRAACALAQGLAFGLNLPLIPVSSLLACAEHARQTAKQEKVLVIHDTQGQKVYCAEYVYQYGWKALMLETSKPLFDLQIKPGYCLTASKNILDCPIFCPTPLNLAYYVAELAKEKFLQQDFPPLVESLPSYVREKIALTRTQRENRL